MFMGSPAATQFHQAFYTQLVQEIFAVMTGELALSWRVRRRRACGGDSTVRALAARLQLVPVLTSSPLLPSACRADTFHKPGFKLQARILHHLFAIVQVWQPVCVRECVCVNCASGPACGCLSACAGGDCQGPLPHSPYNLTPTPNPKPPNAPSHPP